MSSARVDDKLFFIGSCGRSGSTLLKAVLNNHSQIHIPAETFFYISIVPKSNAQNTEAMIDFLLSKWWIKEMKVSKHEVLNRLMYYDRYSAWDSIFLSLIDTLSKNKKASLFGEKSPAHITLATDLLNKYPHSKFIHILRDPRAVFVSYRNVDVGTNQVSAVINQWNNAFKIHQKLINNARYYYLTYEELVLDPESSIKKLCSFLCIEKEDEMLEFHKRKSTGFSIEQNHHSNTLRPIFSDSLRAWSDKIENTDLCLIETYCTKGMNEMGYQLQAPEIRFIKFRYLRSSIVEFLDRHLTRRYYQWKKSLRAHKRLKP